MHVYRKKNFKMYFELFVMANTLIVFRAIRLKKKMLCSPLYNTQILQSEKWLFVCFKIFGCTHGRVGP